MLSDIPFKNDITDQQRQGQERKGNAIYLEALLLGKMALEVPIALE